MADEPSSEHQVPRGWVRHPPERMLITPLMAGLGGMLAFFTVVAIVVWLWRRTKVVDESPKD